jgi:hypothetical protein
LRVGEVGGHGDHDFFYVEVQGLLSEPGQVLEDDGADLGGRELLLPALDQHASVRGLEDTVSEVFFGVLDLGVVIPSSDQALGGPDGAVGIAYHLHLGLRSHQDAAVIHDVDVRRRHPVAPAVRHHFRHAVNDRGQSAGRGAQVYSHDPVHDQSSKIADRLSSSFQLDGRIIQQALF